MDHFLGRRPLATSRLTFGGIVSSPETYRELDFGPESLLGAMLTDRLPTEAGSNTIIDLPKARLRHMAQTPGGLTPAMSRDWNCAAQQDCSLRNDLAGDLVQLWRMSEGGAEVREDAPLGAVRFIRDKTQAGLKGLIGGGGGDFDRATCRAMTYVGQRLSK